jgi:hypothetical protein
MKKLSITAGACLMFVIALAQDTTVPKIIDH